MVHCHGVFTLYGVLTVASGMVWFIYEHNVSSFSHIDLHILILILKNFLQKKTSLTILKPTECKSDNGLSIVGGRLAKPNMQ